jgi:prophage DNA circulation protein
LKERSKKMDPITTAIVAALAAGVAASAKEVGKKVVVDAYDALKTTLKKRFGPDSDLAEAVETLEKKPESAGRQTTVQEEVAAAKAAGDPELQELAQALIEALKSTPEGEKAVGKYQVDVSGGQVGVIGDDAKVEGGIHFGKTKQ